MLRLILRVFREYAELAGWTVWEWWGDSVTRWDLLFFGLAALLVVALVVYG